jgi:hypothetical protein
LLIGLGVLVGVGVGVGVAVALSGGGSGGSSGGGGKYEALAQKSCALVKRADIQTAFKSRPGPAKPDASNGLCNYGAAFPSVTINHEGPAFQADWNSFRAYSAKPSIVDVPGLGGGAYEDPGNGLTVFDAKRRIIFSLIFPDSSPAGQQQLVELARLTLARA